VPTPAERERGLALARTALEGLRAEGPRKAEAARELAAWLAELETEAAP